MDDAELLSFGFKYGFKLHYEGSRRLIKTKNLKSVMQNPLAVKEKIENEIQNGRIAGPFSKRPIWNHRCSPVGIVPTKTSGYRLITHLSYPPSNSVNDFIDNKFSTVQYSSFDKAISIVKKLDKNALIAKMDIKAAFRLLPVYPGDFNLLGYKLILFISSINVCQWAVQSVAQHLKIFLHFCTGLQRKGRTQKI
jgi:hypothetical protein